MRTISPIGSAIAAGVLASWTTGPQDIDYFQKRKKPPSTIRNSERRRRTQKKKNAKKQKMRNRK